MCESLEMLKICSIFVGSKARAEEKERRDEGSEWGDEERERRYRERKVGRKPRSGCSRRSVRNSLGKCRNRIQGLRKFASAFPSHARVVLLFQEKYEVILENLGNPNSKKEIKTKSTQKQLLIVFKYLS